MWTQNQWLTHCDEIIEYFTNHQAQLGGVLERNVGLPMLPPPPRATPTKLLFVGHSPKLLHNGFFGANAEQAFERAWGVRYVAGPNDAAPNRQQTHSYYPPLLALARCVHQGFGVWWQVEETHAAHFKVEFTDICHLPCANDGELKRVWDTNLVPGFREQCQRWLQAEITGMAPDIVVCNGTLASSALRHIAGIGAGFNPARDLPHFYSDGLHARIHLSGFMTSARPLDQFNKARLAREIREQANL